MKTKIYNFLVNRHPGIKQRYHRCRDNARGIKKVLSWAYLFWLNFAYYVLRIRFLGVMAETAVYEEKKLLYKRSESSLAQEQTGTVQAFVEKLSSYDVISFDIFDTLIFRPFSEPADLFFFAGEKLGVMNFKEIRRLMEKKEREACAAVQGHYEVTLEEIWKRLEKETGIPAEVGMQVETGLEKKFCYANPFMLEVFQKLLKQGKKIIIVSDMYLPAAVLEEILCASGFSGYEKLYVSCEYKKSKADGSLFALVRRENPGNIVHVGDNWHSDVIMAKKYGLMSCFYPKVRTGNGNSENQGCSGTNLIKF